MRIRIGKIDHDVTQALAQVIGLLRGFCGRSSTAGGG
ncbi:hypothetical protein QFZ76_000333 [Streptomyces sp. V4I2]|nr:hypothetical protein [Streptomyces sp. V4I2]